MTNTIPNETPDFDTMAVEALTDICEINTPNGVVWYHALKATIADHLRQVWNARGAADYNAIGNTPDESECPDPTCSGVSDGLSAAMRAIRSLDR